jgi:hypothetical protein
MAYSDLEKLFEKKMVYFLEPPALSNINKPMIYAMIKITEMLSFNLTR